MKNYAKWVLVLAALLCSVPLISQWVDKGTYKELKVTNRGIIQLLTPPNDNYFYVVDSNFVYKKYDYDGNLVFERKIAKQDSIEFNRISSDGKSLIFMSFFEQYKDYFIYLSMKIRVMNIEQNTIFRDIFWKDFTSHRINEGGNFSYHFIDYIYSKDSLIVDEHRSHSVSYSGTFINTRFNYNILAFSNDFDNIIISTNSFEQRNDNGLVKVVGKDLMLFKFLAGNQKKSYLIDSSYQNFGIPELNKSGIVPWSIAMSGDTNFFAGRKSNLLYFYRFSNHNFRISDSFKLNYEPAQYRFSKDDRYLIILNTNNQIDFLKVTAKLYLDSITFDSKFIAFEFKILNDSSVIFVRDKNTIRMYEPFVLSDSLIADFYFADSISSTDTRIILKEKAIGRPNTYFWDFGDSTFSSEENPAHIYKSAGYYQITLIVKKGSKSDTCKKNIRITQHIKADFTADNQIGDPNLTVTFTNKASGTNLVFKWLFGDGDSSSIDNPIHIYKYSGLYPVKLIISDGISSDTVFKMDYILINQTPISDTFFLKEKINYSFNENISGMSGFEINDKNYLLELITYNKIKIVKYDQNFDTIWTKELFKGTYHSRMKRSKNGTVYLAGHSEWSDTTFQLNRLSDKDSILFATSLLLQYYMRACEFFPEDSNYYILINARPEYYTTTMKLSIYKFNLNDSIIAYKSNIAGFLTEGNCTSFKMDIKDTILSVYTSAYGKYDRFIFNYFQNPNYAGVSYRGINYSSSIIKHIILNDSIVVSLESNNKIVILNSKISSYDTQKLIFDKQFDSILCYDLIRLDDTCFALAGSKNGNCWFAKMNIKGNIVEEHELNRLGEFKSLSINKDGSLLLIGRIYKNSLVAVIQKNNDKKLNYMLGDGDQYGLYILKTKGSIIDTIENPDSTKKDTVFNDKFSIIPNPAFDEIKVKVPLGFDGEATISLFDTQGRKLFSKIFDKNETINLSEFSIGLYFYTINHGTNIYTGKFVKVK